MSADQTPRKLSDSEIEQILGTADHAILDNVVIPDGVVPVTASLKDGVETVEGALGPATGNIIAIRTTAENLAVLIKSGDIYHVSFSREGGPFHS